MTEPNEVPWERVNEARWERVKEIFADALERPAAEREAFVDGAAGDDAELRAEVRSLLAEETDEYLARPATDLFTIDAPEVGESIGGFRLVGILGEGGMGRVFEAEQERPQRRVALKVLRPGFLSAEAERRFQWEVEALARLAHPGIARVLEAGVAPPSNGRRSSLSWFAMELVEGRPMLEAADALGLDRRARLVLFLRVADAIAHAHQRGVIHRDLKPDNILVDSEARPHVLDFGIARAADPLASAVTTAGEIVGTIGYMSPEQVLGDPAKVDAQSDVYALGVLLYRLLTGEAPIPLDGATLPKAALLLSESDPRPAGQIDRALRGDIETILATALARDPERRYPTVDALAADVKRLLANEPIAARPQSAIYQLGKLARRHRGFVAGLGLAAVALVVGTAGMIVYSVEATRAREATEDALVIAERDRDRANDANDFLNRLLGSASPDAVGRDVRVLELLGTATRELEADTAYDPVVKAALHRTLGETYRRLGALEPARLHLEAALAGFDASAGEEVNATDAAAALAEVLIDLEELERGQDLIDRVRRDLEGSDGGPDWRAARPFELESRLAAMVGDVEGQIAAATRAFELWAERRAPGDDELEVARTNLSNALLAAGRASEAGELLRAGIAAHAARGFAETARAVTQRLNLAQVHVQEGDYVAADAETSELVPIAERVWGEGHPKTLALLGTRASVVQQLGRVEDAVDLHIDVEERSDVTFGPEHREAIVARHNTAIALMYAKRFAEAEERVRRNLALLEADGDDPVMLFQTRTALSSALDGLGRPEEALPISEGALAQLEEFVGPSHPAALIARNNIVALLLDVDQPGRAVDLGRENLDLAREAQPGNRMNEFPFRSNLGRALVRAGEVEAGLAELHAVERFLEADASASSRDRARIAELLAGAYEHAGRAAEAAEWRAAAERRAASD